MLISHAGKVLFKILQAMLQQYVKQELSDEQAGIRKGRGTRDQIANIHWIREKAREFQENIYFCFTEYVEAFDCMDQTNCGKFLKKWGLSDDLTISRETSIQVKKQQLIENKEHQTCSKWGKEYIKAVYCHFCLTYMQSTSCKMSGWMMFKLESWQIYGEK